MLTPAQKQRAYRLRQQQKAAETLARMDAEAEVIGARNEAMEQALREIIRLLSVSKKDWAINMTGIARRGLGEEGK